MRKRANPTAETDTQAIRHAIDLRQRASVMAAVGGEDCREQVLALLPHAEEIEAGIPPALLIEGYATQSSPALLWARTPAELAAVRQA